MHSLVMSPDQRPLRERTASFGGRGIPAWSDEMLEHPEPSSSEPSRLPDGLRLAQQFVCQPGGGRLTLTIEPDCVGRGWAICIFGTIMHELSIMQSALSLALESARQAGASQVRVIRLRIGALSGVVPDALQFAFEALTPGTLAEGAELAIDNVPARFWCATCAREFQSDDMFADCPGCHRASGELRAGREMEVASLEIE